MTLSATLEMATKYESILVADKAQLSYYVDKKAFNDKVSRPNPFLYFVPITLFFVVVSGLITLADLKLFTSSGLLLSVLLFIELLCIVIPWFRYVKKANLAQQSLQAMIDNANEDAQLKINEYIRVRIKEEGINLDAIRAEYSKAVKRKEKTNDEVSVLAIANT